MAAVPVHIARIGIFTFDKKTNQRIDKSGTSPLTAVLNTESRTVVIPDSQIASSQNYPTVDEYLKLEAAGGFSLRYMDQSTIITYG